ncbi:hypothetical protein PNEG_02308 [Pneumocystis murina B123]|uniref:Cytidyltransferase-like domain-containing protein n=1 Tax=Pneumocystis murina (strain B123) TaxID=1069680 RepID=M7NQ20_PNEMU|nr:hypothetical protein PNEG_02308 [Pneumocystis murina B123]EMR09357.1 hypothetical protein PNEG_02308 [Pneumocystis murina B123]
MTTEKTSVFMIQINENLDISKYLGFIDRSISMIKSDELVIFIIEKENKVFQAKNKTRFFNLIHELLNTIYIISENSKKRYNKADLEVNIVFNEWCGYELFSEEKNWDKIYIIKEDKCLIEAISFEMKSYVLILSDEDINSFIIKKKKFERYVKTQIEEESLSYKYVAVGGTFDHLHAGHKILLTMSAWISEENVACGVSDKELLKNKKYAEWIEPIEIRMESVRKFFYLINRTLSLSVSPIFDIYGVTIIDDRIGAIVVSQETISGGKLINEERKRRNMKELDIFCICIISDEVDSELMSIKISSTNIREKIAKKQFKNELVSEILE